MSAYYIALQLQLNVLITKLHYLQAELAQLQSAQNVSPSSQAQVGIGTSVSTTAPTSTLLPYVPFVVPPPIGGDPAYSASPATSTQQSVVQTTTPPTVNALTEPTNIGTDNLPYPTMGSLGGLLDEDNYDQSYRIVCYYDNQIIGAGPVGYWMLKSAAQNLPELDDCTQSIPDL